ncbi:EthD family reductase [Rhizobium sp. BR 314]|uniref:EthD family reductase n=1 Tax=Rhizobium sp. BR 314 TaxID=3040013 RepID=UPI0039BF7A65
MSDQPVTLINLLRCEPGNQEALIALLQENIETVIRTLPGWRMTRLIAAADGTGVVIQSEWETPAAVAAMREDPRMRAYFPRIAALASLETIMGSAVATMTHERTVESASYGPQVDAGAARMVVIYRTPKDPEAFDRHYFDIHVPLAKKLPGLRSYEISHGPIAVPVGSSDIYRIGTLYFDDLAAIKMAFASPEGQAAAADRRIYAPDDSGVQMYLFDKRPV